LEAVEVEDQGLRAQTMAAVAVLEEWFSKT
jgi:hypothetical protein